MPGGPATVLAGQRPGIKEVDDGIWIVSFMQYDLEYIDLEQRSLQSLDNPFGTRLSPMFQVRSVTHVSGTDQSFVVPQDRPPEKARPVAVQGIGRGRVRAYSGSSGSAGGGGGGMSPPATVLNRSYRAATLARSDRARRCFVCRPCQRVADSVLRFRADRSSRV
jgi:hypothetical protein